MSSLATVIDMSKSPTAKLTPLPINAVRLSPDSFWGKYQQAVCERSIPKLFELFEKKGILDNFRRLTGRKKCDRRGPYFTDSDIYKWMEAAAFALAAKDDATIRKQLETAITEIIPAQCEDGYLNTFFTNPKERFTNSDAHEMYCAGHYFQAAVAIYRCLNDDRVLKSAIRFADYLFDRFGPGKKEKWACGHPEIEMALVELYRATGDRKYLRFSRHILDQLNSGASYKTSWSQDLTVPFTQRKELFGHAVRNLYMACGGSDLWAETGDQSLGKAVVRLWENLVNRKIYLTGGVGSRYREEAIGLNYELPNLLAYTETCAAIANVMWNYRNLQITGEARFADWLERSLYNGVISGLSLDYTEYFYMNPLASLGDHHRQEWFDCTCCPSNIIRLLASITGYFYSTGRNGIWVHLYDSGTANLELPNGTAVTVVQETKYPFDGKIKLVLKMPHDAKFDLNLRIPNWAGDYSVKMNHKKFTAKTRSGNYVTIHRTWQNNNTVELDLSMPVQTVGCHPGVSDNVGKVALMRGPLVYCLENVDNPDLPSVHLAAVTKKATATVAPAKGFKLKQPIPAIKFSGGQFKAGKALYSPIETNAVKTKPAKLTAIPYFAWANRSKNSQMTVWIPII
jgi:uncharacterized protein